MDKGVWGKLRFCSISGLILLVVATAAAWLGIRTAENEYYEKIQIINIMLGEDRLDAAVGIMKGQLEEQIKKGKDKLEEYGYSRETYNVLYRDYRKQCGQIIMVSGIVFFLCLICIWFLYWWEKKERAKKIGYLCDVLALYRQESYLVQDKIGLVRENEELEKLGWVIGELGDFLKLLQERVKTEREETKVLVTDISHQLKTPVAALKTSFEVLNKDGLTTGEQLEFAHRCNIQLHGVEVLLEALINISRMESGMIEIKLIDCKIFDTILEAVNRVYTKASEKGIQIEMEAEEHLEELVIPHDGKWLGEAFINVLENAVKYSLPDTCIIIKMMERTSFIRIEFEDWGMGIPREEYHKVFQRFYRGRPALLSGESGSGVGLYLSREIIGKHGGMISVASGKEGGGSVFTVHLPYKK